MSASAPRLRATAPIRRGWPVLRLGFRPFYLGAAAFGMLAVPLWIAQRQGVIGLPLTPTPLLWHAHEMIFGFAGAAISGVVLTASAKAWSSTARRVALRWRRWRCCGWRRAWPA